MLCDPDGKVCVCEMCGQLYSPYWSARKSKGLHEWGTDHRVHVWGAAEALDWLAKTSEAGLT